MKDVDRIGFSDGGFAVESTDGSSVPYTFAQVGRIKFDDAAGIGSVTQSAAGELKPYYRDGMLGADGLAAGQTAKAAVYDLNGRAIMLVGRWDGSCIDVSRLAAGVYTFTVNGVTIKFTK